MNTDKEIVFKVRHNYAQFLSGIQDHASAGEYYELAADILRNNPAEQAKFALESYLGGLNYSIAAKYEYPIVCSTRHCRFMHRCCRTNWTNM